jgi:hypothetical protein
MKEIVVYKAKNGVLETDPLRALAWNIEHDSKNSISFVGALWLVRNEQYLYELIEMLRLYSDEN